MRPKESMGRVAANVRVRPKVTVSLKRYEIAQSLNSDPSAVVNLTTAIGLKLNRAGDNITGNLGVGNVTVTNQYTFDVNGTAHVSGNTNLDRNLNMNNGNINLSGSIMQF
jgi:hypothetical protein